MARFTKVFVSCQDFGLVSCCNSCHDDADHGLLGLEFSPSFPKHKWQATSGIFERFECSVCCAVYKALHGLNRNDWDAYRKAWAKAIRSARKRQCHEA